MTETVNRRNPIQHLLELRGPEFRMINGGTFAVRFPSVESEDSARRTLGLCDLSGLAKLGLKGRDAAGWLATQDVDVPPAVYESRDLADGGVIVRIGADEFLLESGISGRSVSALAEQFRSRDPHTGRLERIERQEATFALCGAQALDVLRQTCSIHFDDVLPRHFLWTRVAGVNCGIIKNAIGPVQGFRLWADCSYAEYLWETLAEICASLDGRVIGAAAIFPDLLR
ncbi:MAG: hypothetical protein AB7U20_01635 [Planctomycetaceae bacterium]